MTSAAPPCATIRPAISAISASAAGRTSRIDPSAASRPCSSRPAPSAEGEVALRIEADDPLAPLRRRSARTAGSAARRRIRWRRGGAGRPARRGTPRARRCHARSAPASPLAAPSDTGLVSTRWIEIASRKSGTFAATRRMSAISVPRPGPSSTSRTGEGLSSQPPGLDQPGADDLAEHLADLRRGDEVAARAEGIARHVIAVRRIAEAVRHVFGDASSARSLR